MSIGSNGLEQVLGMCEQSFLQGQVCKCLVIIEIIIVVITIIVVIINLFSWTFAVFFGRGKD